MDTAEIQISEVKKKHFKMNLINRKPKFNLNISVVFEKEQTFCLSFSQTAMSGPSSSVQRIPSWPNSSIYTTSSFQPWEATSLGRVFLLSKGRGHKQNWENKKHILPSLLVLYHPACVLPPQQNLPGSLPKKNQLSPLCFYSPLYVVALYAPVCEPDPLIC